MKQLTILSFAGLILIMLSCNKTKKELTNQWKLKSGTQVVKEDYNETDYNRMTTTFSSSDAEVENYSVSYFWGSWSDNYVYDYYDYSLTIDLQKSGAVLASSTTDGSSSELSGSWESTKSTLDIHINSMTQWRPRLSHNYTITKLTAAELDITYSDNSSNPTINSSFEFDRVF